MTKECDQIGLLESWFRSLFSVGLLFQKTYWTTFLLGQWSEYVGHPDESLAIKSVYSRLVRDASLG